MIKIDNYKWNQDMVTDSFGVDMEEHEQRCRIVLNSVEDNVSDSVMKAIEQGILTDKDILMLACVGLKIYAIGESFFS